MSGLVESALAIMSGSERRIAVASNNVANIATTGFKRQISFSDALASSSSASLSTPSVQVRSDFAAGRLTSTNNPLDLAIAGSGFFRLRDGDAIVYSRQGQFQRAENGAIVTPQGHVLQQAEGGDLVLESDAVEILPDGTVVDGDRPIARIAVFAAGEGGSLEALGGSIFTMPEGAAEEVASPMLRQGMTEASNVVLSYEMVGMMAALRQAEGGARLIMVYDELLGRAIQTFGQGGR